MNLRKDLFEKICCERRSINTRMPEQTVTLLAEVARESQQR